MAHSITVIFWLTTSLDYIPTWSSSADNPKWNGHRRCSKSFQHYWQQYNSRFSSQIVRLTQKAMCVHLVPELDFLQRFRFSYSYVIFTFISLSFSRKSRWEVQVMGQVFANWVLKLPWRHWFQRQLEYGFSSFFKPFLEYLISF